MKIKCLIVDDEPPAQRLLEKYIENIPMLKLEGKCNNAFEANEFMHSNTVDLIFLDINMPKMSGLSFLQTLNNPPKVIITTAFREYAMEGFELDVVDYLKKPIPFERFVKAVNKAVVRIMNTQSSNIALNSNSLQEFEDPFIFVKDENKTYRLDLKDIYYIEAFGDYSKIITAKRVYVTHHTMKKFETCLPSKQFTRVHKSFIISISKINSIEGNTLIVNDVIIPIGQTYRKSFFQLIDSLNNLIT